MDFKNYKIVLLEWDKSELFFKLIDDNRERLESFFAGTVSRTKTLEDTNSYVEVIEQKIKDKSYFPYIIIDKKADKFVGLIDVKNINWSIPKAEIGYFIDANYEGRGLISEALGIVVDYLVSTYKFKKLLCRANSKNVGSLKVALKNDFELEGTIRYDYKTTAGELVDLNYYGRIF